MKLPLLSSQFMFVCICDIF